MALNKFELYNIVSFQTSKVVIVYVLWGKINKRKANDL